MNNKDLKQLLKDKAQKVNIKDLSKEILEKVDHMPSETIVIPQKRWQFKFKPAYVMALTLILGLFLIVISWPNADTSNIALESYDDALMTSIISMSYVFDANSDELLSFGLNQTDEAGIDDEIPNIIPYVSFMESLLSSNASYDVQILIPTEDDVVRHLRFKTTNLFDDEYNFELKVYQERIIESRILRMFATAIINDLEYDMAVVFDLENQRRMQIVFELEDDKKLRIASSPIGTQMIYDLSIELEDQIISHIRMTKDPLEGFIDLNFVNARALGTYRFRLKEDKMIQVSYAMFRNNLRETGRIDIEPRILSDESRAYGITVRPQGRDPYEAPSQQRPTTPPPRVRPNPRGRT